MQRLAHVTADFLEVEAYSTLWAGHLRAGRLRIATGAWAYIQGIVLGLDLP